MLCHVGEVWSHSILHHQMHRVLTGAPALRSVVNVGEGMAGLVLLPLQHYRKDGRVLRGLRRGTMRCLKGLTVETLSATHKVGHM